MKAIIPNLIENSQIPLYIQLYEHIKSAILSKEIAFGEKLPSLRNLSTDLGVSVTTVDLAYSQLMVEGYIYSKPQSGYYVANSLNPLYAMNDVVPSDVFATSFDETPPHDVLQRFSDSSLRFKVDTSCFDFNKWKKCINKVLTNCSHMLLSESDSQGESALRYEIAKYLYSFRGVSCSPDQVIISAGTQQTSQHLSRVLQDLDIYTVATETPGYAPVTQIFRNNRFSIFEIPVLDDGIEIEKLPVNIPSAVYVNPSNQFPTGSVMPIGRRYDLLAWAEKNDSYIIEDDYDSELRYFGRPILALKSLDHSNRVIYLGSFSSTLFPAIKISYMVLPEKPLEKYVESKDSYSQTCSKTEQLALSLYMAEGKYMSGIKKLRRLYSQKLNAVISQMKKTADDFITIHNTYSGITVSLKVNTGKSAAILSAEAESLGLNVIESPAVKTDDLKIKDMIFYYNQIPLTEISDSVKQLTNLWRE